MLVFEAVMNESSLSKAVNGSGRRVEGEAEGNRMGEAMEETGVASGHKREKTGRDERSLASHFAEGARKSEKRIFYTWT